MEKKSNLMKKQKMTIFGKDNYLLGKDADGTKYFLLQPSWDCEWYWGFGYVRTYTNNANPSRSKYMKSHQHFDNLFFNNPDETCFRLFRRFFVPPYVLSEKDTWSLLELMKSAYTARAYSEMLFVGGAYLTANPVKEIIVCKEEYDRINQEIIPALMGQVAQLLSPVE